jgi:hypothetical protein
VYQWTPVTGALGRRVVCEEDVERSISSEVEKVQLRSSPSRIVQGLWKKHADAKMCGLFRGLRFDLFDVLVSA